MTLPWTDDYIDHVDVDEDGTAHFINNSGIEIARENVTTGRYQYNVDYADPFHIDTHNYIGENPINAVHLHYTAGTGTGNATDWWRAAQVNTTATNYTFALDDDLAIPTTFRTTWDYIGPTPTPTPAPTVWPNHVQGNHSVTERIKNFFFGDKDSEQERPVKMNMKLLFED